MCLPSSAKNMSFANMSVKGSQSLVISPEFVALLTDIPRGYFHSLTWCRHQNLTTRENSQEEIVVRMD